MPESAPAGAAGGAVKATLGTIRKALALPEFDALHAQSRMAPRQRPLRRPDSPGEARLASVLILMYPDNPLAYPDSALYFPLMRRTEYDGVHSGQISLPGGSREASESLEHTAIRETREEFGVLESIEILGALTPLYVPPSNFEIHPYVGYLSKRPAWAPDPREVAEIIEAPVSVLFDETAKGTEEATRDGARWSFPYYRVGPHKVWGATAAILSELETRLQAALASQ